MQPTAGRNGAESYVLRYDEASHTSSRAAKWLFGNKEWPVEAVDYP